MTEKNSLALLQQDFKLFLQALWHELHLPTAYEGTVCDC